MKEANLEFGKDKDEEYFTESEVIDIQEATQKLAEKKGAKQEQERIILKIEKFQSKLKITSMAFHILEQLKKEISK